MASRVHIHPTAVVDSRARLAPGVIIGPYAVIEGNVELGEGCIVHSHCVIKGPVIAGRENEFYPFSVIGEPPQHLTKGKIGGVRIGDRNVFREHVSVHASTEPEGTRIGNGNYFMATSHVAHDCVVGDGNIFANYVGLAGHVEVGSNNFFGGHSGIHQFARVGSFCMIGGGSMVPKDVAPFTIVQGDRAHFAGLNAEGLKRAGYSVEDIAVAREVVKIFFRSGLLVQEALKLIEEKLGDHELSRMFVEFVKKSRRGITR